MSVPTSWSWARCEEPPKTGAFRASRISSSVASGAAAVRAAVGKNIGFVDV
jgi:hypothetical protein